MATPLETRGRSATVAAMQGKVDQSFAVGALERTSSDSQLSKPERALTLREIAAASAISAQENAADTMPSDSHPIDPAVEVALVSEPAAAATADGTAEEDAAARAIAQAEAVRAEMSAPSTSEPDTSAQPPANTATATLQSQEQTEEAGCDEADGAATVAVREKEEKDVSKGAVKFDPWLEKVIPEEEATTRNSQPTVSRFFGLSSNRPDGVATRVSRWMPFDSHSDAKAASRRSSSDWWQTPEEPEEAAAGESAQVTDNAQVTELPPTNPFAADVARSAEAQNEAAAAGKDESEEKKESSETVESQADDTTGNGVASAIAERDDRELSPADDNVASSSAVASTKDEAKASGEVTMMSSTSMLDDKKLDDSWKLMLKSALLSNMASRDKHSSAVEYHPYILLLKEDKLCIHHVPEFFREVSGKKSTYAEQVGKRQALMEIKLEPSMRFGNVERKRVLRDSRARLHIAKLQSWQQREFKGLRALLGSGTRTEVRTVLKIGSGSLTALESFIESIDRQIRLMPVDMSREISFRRDEIYCDLVDDCDIQLAFDGTLLSRRSTVHVMVQAYLSGQAECQMVLNDRKLANEHRNKPSGVFLPPSKDLIDMSHVECHSATNREIFEQSRLVRFGCLKGLRFEALRFKVTGSLPPPLEVRGLLCETVENVVNLRANLKWHPQSGRVRFAVHDVEFHIPVPSSWCGILETKNALGMRRSIKAKSSFRGSIRRKRQTTTASLDVSVGSAKYEPESEALVWRIEDFPTERNANTTLTCRLELSPSMERADFNNKQCVMRYGVAGSCVSGTTVWSLQVPSVQVKPAKKWVKYDTKFRYLIDMLPSTKYEIAGEDD